MQWYDRNRLMWGKQKISLDRETVLPVFILHLEGTHLHSKNPQVLFGDCASDYPRSAASVALCCLET